MALRNRELHAKNDDDDATTPAVPSTLKLLRMLQVLGKVKQPAKFQHRISMHHAVMRMCISHRLTIICAKNGVFRGLEGEDMKILCSDPQKAPPCVNTHLLMYRNVKIGSTA